MGRVDTILRVFTRSDISLYTPDLIPLLKSRLYLYLCLYYKNPYLSVSIGRCRFSVHISNIILSVLASDLDYTKEVPGVRASSRSS